VLVVLVTTVVELAVPAAGSASATGARLTDTCSPLPALPLTLDIMFCTVLMKLGVAIWSRVTLGSVTLMLGPSLLLLLLLGTSRDGTYVRLGSRLVTLGTCSSSSSVTWSGVVVLLQDVLILI
jgi:hypothetical protein